MGWFLRSQDAGRAKAGRGSKRSGKRAKATDPKPWDPQRTLEVLRWSGWIAAAVAVVVGWVYVEGALTAYASARHADEVTEQTVVLDDRPAWMSDAVADRLAAVVGDRVGADPLDIAALRTAVGALSADPWVRQVGQVRRGADGLVHVEAEYREPVAVARAGDMYVLLDREAVRLPGLYERHQVQLLGLPEVTGVAAGAPRVGEAWRGDDLAAGIELALLVRAQPYGKQIEALDVAGRDERGRLSLVLLAGRREIVWGLPVGHGMPIEPADDATKLARLARLAQDPGGLAGDPRVAELNAVGGIRLHRGSLENAAARGEPQPAER